MVRMKAPAEDGNAATGRLNTQRISSSQTKIISAAIWRRAATANIKNSIPFAVIAADWTGKTCGRSRRNGRSTDDI
jgi:hypothetical protein